MIVDPSDCLTNYRPMGLVAFLILYVLMFLGTVRYASLHQETRLEKNGCGTVAP